MVNVTDRYSKLTRATPTTNLTSAKGTPIFSHDQAVPYRTPDDMLSENDQHFPGEFFTSLCIYSRVKKLKSTAFYPQTNVQLERYNETLVS